MRVITRRAVLQRSFRRASLNNDHRLVSNPVRGTNDEDRSKTERPDGRRKRKRGDRANDNCRLATHAIRTRIKVYTIVDSFLELRIPNGFSL